MVLYLQTLRALRTWSLAHDHCSKWNASILLHTSQNKGLPIQIDNCMQIRSTGVIIEASDPLIGLFSTCANMGKGMLLNHAPMRVIKATGCLDKLASFLAPGIVNETKASTVARPCSYSLLVNFECIFSRLEKRQSTFNLDIEILSQYCPHILYYNGYTYSYCGERNGTNLRSISLSR
jgi:hypothetical protein